MQTNDHTNVFNEMPPAVVALAIFVAAIELIFQVGSYGMIGGADAVGWRLSALHDFAFFDPIFDEMVAKNLWPIAHVQRIISYGFVHASFMQCLMVVMFILALGKMAGERFGNIAVLTIFFTSLAVGALGYGLVLDTQAPLYGGYPGVFGLVGAYSFLLFVGLGAMGKNRLQAFRLIGFLVAIRVVFSMFGEIPLSLVAELFGFVSGFVVSALFVPGAFARIFDRLRRR